MAGTEHDIVKGLPNVGGMGGPPRVASTDFSMGGTGPNLEIVRSVSGNFNVFTEKFLQKERKYLFKNV